MTTETPWVALKDVHQLYGYSSIAAARNAVSAGRFPVETYKLGVLIVIDREVHREFFLKYRKSGLRALRGNERLSEHQHGGDDES